MSKLSGKLRIGEKIGFSFGIVAFLFLLVIWRYQSTLEQALADYRNLQDVYEAKETYASDIETSLLIANAEANGFLVDRDPARVEAVDRAMTELTRQAERLGSIDDAGKENGQRIKQLADAYQLSFHKIYEGWRIKGLDHDSGLQGAFRNTVHELEALAEHYKVDALYIDLLQIRRGEKDLGLRRESQYRDLVLDLLDGFLYKLRASNLETSVREKLELEIATYREAFLAYATRVLDNESTMGGKGPFRQAAHRIEDVLKAHRVPDLDATILQLRRREKDYLLRLDHRYVDMALSELGRIRQSVDSSVIANSEKSHLGDLISDYERDFLALVEQNSVIDRLQGEMEGAAREVISLVDKVEANADKATLAATARINTDAQENAELMGWIVLFTVLLSIVLGLIITRLITRPLINMAGFLDRLALEAPIERIPTTDNSRNEVAAMAESVNRMADHKARLIAWWKSSLEEMEAERDRWAALSQATNDDSTDPTSEHREAVGRRIALLKKTLGEMRLEAEGIRDEAGKLGEDGKSISKSAREIMSRIDILLTQAGGQ